MFFTDANRQGFDLENWEYSRQSSSGSADQVVGSSRTFGAPIGAHTAVAAPPTHPLSGFTSLFQDVTNTASTMQQQQGSSSMWSTTKSRGGADSKATMSYHGTDEDLVDPSTELHSRTGSGESQKSVVERPGAPLPPQELLDLLGCTATVASPTHLMNDTVASFGRQLTSDTVMSWTQHAAGPFEQLGDPSMTPASLPYSPILGRNSPSPVAPPISTLVPSGNFLCASKLLMLAQSHAAADPSSGWASRSNTDDSDRRSPSPSRSPLPSIHHAVLSGIDDDSPAKPAPKYASFSVSAGASRDPTPVSPTAMMGDRRFPSYARSQGCSPTHATSVPPTVPSSQPYDERETSARRAMRSHRVPNVPQPQAKPQVLELPSPQTCVMVLEFKMGRKLRCRSCADLAKISQKAVGSYFVVQVDSSGLLDSGVCTAVLPMTERHTLNRAFGCLDQATIIRQANEADCHIINQTLPDLEEEALQQCHQLIHFLHLPFVCVDAEYSFDQQACKLFYSLAPQACTSIVPNVSRLQRELSFKLKCKITVEQVKATAS